MSSRASVQALETYGDQPDGRSRRSAASPDRRAAHTLDTAQDAAVQWLTTDERRGAACRLVETSARRDLLEVTNRVASRPPKSPGPVAADPRGRVLRWRMVVSTTEATTSGTRELLAMMSRSGPQVTAHGDVPAWAVIADDTVAIVSTGAADRIRLVARAATRGWVDA